RIFAAVNLIYGNFEQCVYHQQRALALNPNDDLIVVQQGEILTWCGQPQEGIEWIRKAMRLNPYHPERFWGHLARASFVAGAYGEALAAARRITTPDATLFALIAACEVRRGDVEAARRCIAEMRARWPAFGLADLVATLHYRDAADRDRHLETLAQAGLRE
ncbi:MAG TPA: hypothetical protein PLG77_06170, partial [Burkholderiaceae bacterium]|nr:hypothetical protein [Burkholderiaceae bacterium]